VKRTFPGKGNIYVKDLMSMTQCKSTCSGVLDEVEIRQLLISHVGHQCCWGSGPARRWKMTSIEDCNVYVGTLETFIEERDTVIEKEPYVGGEIDRADKGPQLGVWELDLRDHFPQLFIADKEVRFKIPHSEAVHKCPGKFALLHSQHLFLSVILNGGKLMIICQSFEMRLASSNYTK
jgi:hypothetical protein